MLSGGPKDGLIEITTTAGKERSDRGERLVYAEDTVALENVSDTCAAWKARTTVLNGIAVWPVKGVLEPGEAADLTIRASAELADGAAKIQILHHPVDELTREPVASTCWKEVFKIVRNPANPNKDKQSSQSTPRQATPSASCDDTSSIGNDAEQWLNVTFSAPKVPPGTGGAAGAVVVAWNLLKDPQGGRTGLLTKRSVVSVPVAVNMRLAASEKDRPILRIGLLDAETDRELGKRVHLDVSRCQEGSVKEGNLTFGASSIRVSVTLSAPGQYPPAAQTPAPPAVEEVKKRKQFSSRRPPSPPPPSQQQQGWKPGAKEKDPPADQPAYSYASLHGTRRSASAEPLGKKPAAPSARGRSASKENPAAKPAPRPRSGSRDSAGRWAAASAASSSSARDRTQDPAKDGLGRTKSPSRRQPPPARATKPARCLPAAQEPEATTPAARGEEQARGTPEAPGVNLVRSGRVSPNFDITARKAFDALGLHSGVVVDASHPPAARRAPKPVANDDKAKPHAPPVPRRDESDGSCSEAAVSRSASSVSGFDERESLPDSKRQRPAAEPRKPRDDAPPPPTRVRSKSVPAAPATQGPARTHSVAPPGFADFAAAGAEPAAAEASQRIKVFLRFRPVALSPGPVEVNRELFAAGQPVPPAEWSPWSVDVRRAVVKQKKEAKVYTFDSIIPEAANNSDVYAVTNMTDLMRKYVSGVNCSVLAYGQTSSGKTHTIFGNEARIPAPNSLGGNPPANAAAKKSRKGRSGSDTPRSVRDDDKDSDKAKESPTDGPPVESGVVPKAVVDLFKVLQEHQGAGGGEPALEGYSLKATFFEIYNEEVIDLLQPPPCPTVVLRETAYGEFLPIGLKEEEVSSVEQTLQLIERGDFARSVGFSNLNERSSRSHTIFRLSLTKYRVQPQGNGGEGKRYPVRRSEFNLVDLAGSESLYETPVPSLKDEFGSQFVSSTADPLNVQRKETKNINLSLSFLKKVITELSQPKARAAAAASHVSYRNSALTKVLKQALGGNSLTTIICTATRAEKHRKETKNTLLFGMAAKNVKNSARVNVCRDDSFSGRRTPAATALIAARAEQTQQIRLLTEENGRLAVRARQLEDDNAELAAECAEAVRAAEGQSLRNDQLEARCRSLAVESSKSAADAASARSGLRSQSVSFGRTLRSLEDGLRHVYSCASALTAASSDEPPVPGCPGETENMPYSEDEAACRADRPRLKAEERLMNAIEAMREGIAAELKDAPAAAEPPGEDKSTPPPAAPACGASAAVCPMTKDSGYESDVDTDRERALRQEVKELQELLAEVRSFSSGEAAEKGGGNPGCQLTVQEVVAKDSKIKTLVQDVFDYVCYGCPVYICDVVTHGGTNGSTVQAKDTVMLYLSEIPPAAADPPNAPLLSPQTPVAALFPAGKALTNKRYEIAVCTVDDSGIPNKRAGNLRSIPLEGVSRLMLGRHGLARCITFYPTDSETPPIDVVCKTSTDKEAWMVITAQLSNCELTWDAALEPADVKGHGLLACEEAFCMKTHMLPADYQRIKQSTLGPHGKEGDAYLTVYDVRIATSLDIFRSAALLSFYHQQRWVTKHDVYKLAPASNPTSTALAPRRTEPSKDSRDHRELLGSLRRN